MQFWLFTYSFKFLFTKLKYDNTTPYFSSLILITIKINTKPALKKNIKMPCACSNAGIFQSHFPSLLNWSWIQMMLRISICTEVWNGKFIFNQSSAAVSWKKLSFYSALVSHKSITNWHFRSLLAGWLWCDGELLREAWCWYWQCHNFCIMVCHSFRKVEWIAHAIWKEKKETNQLFTKVNQMAMQWYDHDSWVY